MNAAERNERNERAASYISLKQYQRRMERQGWIGVGLIFALSVFLLAIGLLTLV